MAKLLQHLELVLTLVGLVLTCGVAALTAHLGRDPWQAAAVTGVAVGVIHGLMFWAFRQRRRRERQRVFADIQWMLKDVINNQLAVISIASGISGSDNSKSGRAMAVIARSVETISAALHDLSAASLERWRKRYGDAAAPLEPPSAGQGSGGR